ncbi:methyl-accepting chemotaxis protein [Vibrio sp. IRLE0018]|uniref:methyl-accepting chemotaxis protein n=1 Tax=Vibrio floridensis TaxID=2908007 RepID=UPI001F2C9671|nr:methyl-accepting chemotaxis protein [Vibrio floridensis]MCF8778402.1 methyl-accepting chemotaxis protein [Vibrio floridensis]
MFVNLSVKQKIIFPVFLIISLFAVSSVLNILASQKQTELTITLRDQVIPTLFKIEDAYRDMYQATSAIQGLVLSDTKQEIEREKFEYSDNAHKAIPRMKAAQKLIDSGLLPSNAQRELDVLVTLANSWLKDYETLLSLPEDQWFAYYDENKGTFDKKFSATRKQLNVVKELVEASQQELQKQVNDAAAQAERTLELGTLLVIMLATVMCWFLIKAIVTPIEHIRTAMDEIASGDGDLRQRIKVESQDEIGQLAGAFNLFVSKIQATIEQVVNTTNNVRSEMNQLTEITRSVADSTYRQQQESEVVAAAVHEMQATSQSVSDNATDAATESHNADHEVQTTSQIVDSTVAAIRRLADDVDDASQVINTLDQDVSNIASILDVIRGIAEQTNLLALNAAIEAARAGEQGRGFAVVADEVRSLASRTQQSTGEIQTMIERLQGGARQAVSVMESSKRSSDSTIESAQTATHSLQEILRAIANMSEMNTQIATAANQQSSVSEEVNANVQRIADNSSAIVSVVQNAETAIQRLSQQCGQLDRLVSQFKC